MSEEFYVLQVKDVAAFADMNISVLVGEHESLSRPVAGAHVIEAADPLRWLPPHWMLFTTGMRLVDRPAEQRRLAQDLAAGSIAALAFGAGIVFDEVPSALEKEARDVGVPILVVPELTPFRDVIRLIEESVLVADATSLRHSASLSEKLIQALAHGDPFREVPATLARELHCEISIHHPDGAVLTSNVTPSVAARTWESLKQSHRLTSTLEIQTDAGSIARAIGGPDRVSHWLVVTTTERSPARRIVSHGVDVAVQLLTSISTVRQSDQINRRWQREQVLRGLCALTEGVDAQGSARSRLRTSASELGIDIDAPGRVAVFSPIAGDEDSLLATLENIFARERTPFLLAADRSDVLALLPAGIDLSETMHQVSEKHSVAVGLGRPTAAPEDASESLRDARTAVVGARQRGPGAILTYENLGLVEWLALEVDSATFSGHAARILEPLVQHEHLLHTLTTYFDNRLSIPATARSLHVHENSLRYRLSRIENLLDCDLRAVKDLSELYLALLLSGSDKTT